jgi:hypothetical protein
MTIFLRAPAILLVFLTLLVSVAHSAPARPPVGVPADAVHFNGKWYRIYHERGTWKRSRERCVVLGGQLAIIPDEPTQTFIKNLAAGLPFWLGATDEKTRGLWQWIDGQPMKYKAWDQGQPNQGHPKERYLVMDKSGLWHDYIEGADHGVVGFICEWRGKD